MLHHFESCINAKGDEAMLALQLANAPHMDSKSQADLVSAIREMQEFQFARKPSPYDGMGREERIIAIGSAITGVGGESWLSEHPRQRAWLESEGVSVAACVSAHRDWFEKHRSDERWRPARSTLRKASPAST